MQNCHKSFKTGAPNSFDFTPVCDTLNLHTLQSAYCHTTITLYKKILYLELDDGETREVILSENCALIGH